MSTSIFAVNTAGKSLRQSDVRTAKFVPAFGDRLIKLVDALKVDVDHGVMRDRTPVETTPATSGST